MLNFPSTFLCANKPIDYLFLTNTSSDKLLIRNKGSISRRKNATFFAELIENSVIISLLLANFLYEYFDQTT